MDTAARFEQELDDAVSKATAAPCPPRLAEAIRYAVFPGGARIRPRLCLAVAKACGDSNPTAAFAAASAIELLHCGSLVHDDLPCFDDADIRRGKPSVHCKFGEPLAVLVGDALISLAFETLATRLVHFPAMSVALSRIISGTLGAPAGIIAGQAWECEKFMDMEQYQRSKTGMLFAACTMSGAEAAGYDSHAWQTMGLAIGEAFQVGDDIRDVAAEPSEVGKPVGQDHAHGRPNAVEVLGIEGAKKRFKSLLETAIEAIPDCPGIQQLRLQIVAVSQTLVTSVGERRAA